MEGFAVHPLMSCEISGNQEGREQDNLLRLSHLSRAYSLSPNLVYEGQYLPP